jgi:uncharacterized protein (TIGR02118 family)
MIKILVMYGPPTDPEAFDAYYMGTHVPIAEKVPGLRRFEVSKLSNADGTPSPTYLMAELYFDSPEAAAEAMATEEGKAAGADVANFATGGVTLLNGAILKEG